MEQTNLTPEQRKQIAEWMGYEVVNQEEIYAYHPITRELQKYTPDTNDAQAWGLLEEADKQGFNIYLENSGNRKYATLKKRTDRTHCAGPTYKGGGDTYREAICHAVLALEGEG